MIWVGTSGWQYASWKERFYPKGLPQRAWLDFYTERFPVVEVNNSFYRLPSATAFNKWRKQAPVDFLFAVKAKSASPTRTVRFFQSKLPILCKT